VAALHQFTTAYYTYAGWIRTRNGNRWRNAYPNTMLPCKDGWVGMIVGGGEFWPSFCLMIGRPELPEDPRFATPAARLEHADELDGIIVAALADRTMEEIFTEAQTTWRVPVTMLADIDRLLDDPHLNERGFWRSVDADAGTTLRYPGSPFRFDGERSPPEGSAAAPGADNTKVFATLMDAGARADDSGSSTATGEGERTPAGPLRGVRILDLTRIYAGPLATRILADLGAEVIKVEAISGRGPAVLPAVRQAINYLDGTPGDEPWNRQGAFNELNRCKQSVALDLKSEQGRDIFLRLVAISDVVMENFSVRAMERLGLDYERLREVNERLIYVAMPGFGISGPYRDYVILGPGLEPMTGVASMLGYEGGDPMVSTVALPDAIGGVTAAAAAVTALRRRAESGQGALVDFSLQEAAIATLGERFIERQLSGRHPPRVGNAHAVYAPHGVYRCRGDDQWIAIAVRDDEEWRSLCATAGRGWADETRFATQAARHEHRKALDEAIESWTAPRDKTELMHALQRSGVPAGGLVDAAELVGDPHLGERGFFVELDHPAVGPKRYQGTPVLLDGRRGSSWRAAPTLGEHNGDVLGGLLGLSETELEALAGRGVIASRPPVEQTAREAREAR
jgi:crotonobetainyl-CoA:carnitine CoA-transferase CaiB-like acyl-CoA transferase